MMTNLTVDERELSTILAGLRLWQVGMAKRRPDRAIKQVAALAWAGGDPLSTEEIDDLCDRLHGGPLDIKP
jgi:hypothetical protein